MNLFPDSLILNLRDASDNSYYSLNGGITFVIYYIYNLYNNLLYIIGVTGLADYCASKFGAVGFDESLRMELDPYSGVHTTVVCPFYINTGMFDGVTTRSDRLITRSS